MSKLAKEGPVEEIKGWGIDATTPTSVATTSEVVPLRGSKAAAQRMPVPTRTESEKAAAWQVEAYQKKTKAVTAPVHTSGKPIVVKSRARAPVTSFAFSEFSECVAVGYQDGTVEIQCVGQEPRTDDDESGPNLNQYTAKGNRLKAVTDHRDGIHYISIAYLSFIVMGRKNKEPTCAIVACAGQNDRFVSFIRFDLTSNRKIPTSTVIRQKVDKLVTTLTLSGAAPSTVSPAPQCPEGKAKLVAVGGKDFLDVYEIDGLFQGTKNRKGRYHGTGAVEDQAWKLLQRLDHRNAPLSTTFSGFYRDEKGVGICGSGYKMKYLAASEGTVVSVYDFKDENDGSEGTGSDGGSGSDLIWMAMRQSRQIVLQLYQISQLP